ncbi:unnamed protein product [Rhizophagus irregularis]|nr:unnamed protein product [Rhizophagus irregularis]
MLTTPNHTPNHSTPSSLFLIYSLSLLHAILYYSYRHINEIRNNAVEEQVGTFLPTPSLRSTQKSIEVMVALPGVVVVVVELASVAVEAAVVVAELASVVIAVAFLTTLRTRRRIQTADPCLS